MNNFYKELNLRILEMSDGDEEFKIELTSAILSGLVELKTVYGDGIREQNEVKIQQIRHKIKPTLSMFDFDLLIDCLNEGKCIFESQGFGDAAAIHFQDFLQKVSIAIEKVNQLKS
jgi:hypothetical protein